jgi:hypothetical protein
LQYASGADNILVLTGLQNPALRKGGYLYMNCQVAAGTPAELYSNYQGSEVKLNLFLRNSTIKGQGES